LIHSTAIIEPGAKLGDHVEIGAYSIIGADVDIGAGTRIGPHVVIRGPTVIGKNNRIFQFSSLGDDPQDKKYDGDTESRLCIGDNNTIREFCTINRGTTGGGGVTRIGDGNWIMAYVHIAHDCLVGDNNVFANNATLAGHVTVESNVILGGFTGVHQFCRIGRHSFSAIASVIVKDVPPYLIVSGNTARPNGLNREGLKRHGMTQDCIEDLRKAYRLLYRDSLLLKDALAKIDELARVSAEVEIFTAFIKASTRGIVR
jgi:UDP-N-acetylglucosamine acyltransferase